MKRQRHEVRTRSAYVRMLRRHCPPLHMVKGYARLCYE